VRPVPDPPTPTVWRHWLAAELRRLREAAGKTLEEVADELECSRAKVSRIELGRVRAHPREVEAMLAFYGAGPEEREELVGLARQARRKSWWHEFRDLDQDDELKQVAFVDNETAATSIRTYQAVVVFGLFQTEDYARAVLRALRLDLPEREIERHVELRMRRQKLLDSQQMPSLWVVLDEAALRRPIGGRDTMRQQLNRLMEVADHPKVKLQALPYEAGEHAGLDGAFMILGFSEAGFGDVTDKDLISLENTLSDQYLREPTALRRYIALFEAIAQRAYGTERSSEFIAEISKDL
jgi:transcriptional regulator with XRE-family HTH domain